MPCSICEVDLSCTQVFFVTRCNWLEIQPLKVTGLFLDPAAMAPKRRAAAVAPVAALCPPPAFEDASIPALLCEVELNLDVIRKHKVFKDIMNALPLSIGEGGSQEPFDQDSFKKVMESGGNYTCGINFMWIGHKLRAMAGVPMSRRAINMFLTHKRFENYKFPSLIEIAVDSVT